MGSLVALMIATPIFGFALQAPVVTGALDVSAETAAALQVDGGSPDTTGPAADASEAGDAADDEYVHETKLRNEIASVHRAFGIATWAAMTATVAIGFMTYYNQYGFFAGQGDNPCVTGDAIFGDGGCNDLRTAHAVSATLTTVLYATAFTLSIMMPDPDDLSEGKGEFASTLRLHKTLRWVHLSGMVAQILLGIVIANDMLGLDRANDYGTLQAIATVHMATGLVTYGALTWAGALMTF